MQVNVVDLCRRRRSVRAFTGETISTEDEAYLMEAARWAATSSNRQARRFVIISDSVRIGEIVEQAHMQDFVAGASLLIFGVATERGKRGALADVLISMTQMEMAAVERGLGTIWLGYWDRDVVPGMIGATGELEVVMGMAIGCAADEGAPKEKLSVEDLFVYDHL